MVQRETYVTYVQRETADFICASLSTSKTFHVGALFCIHLLITVDSRYVVTQLLYDIKIPALIFDSYQQTCTE